MFCSECNGFFSKLFRVFQESMNKKGMQFWSLKLIFLQYHCNLMKGNNKYSKKTQTQKFNDQKKECNMSIYLAPKIAKKKENHDSPTQRY